MLQVLAEEEHLDESRVAKVLGNLSNAFDEGIETYVCVCMYVCNCMCMYVCNCMCMYVCV